ncbi:DNA-directed RNA polymerase subunit omega [Candidatus Desantisbacteria bacterium]|nr:DNA-directed RNA polymerase subunit omega [Candidatus Desantisbacteria bacterium]
MQLDGLFDKAPDRYKLSIAISQRALQIQQGSRPLIETKEKNPIAIALEEVAQGKVVITAE